jgi:hypothetical protein
MYRYGVNKILPKYCSIVTITAFWTQPTVQVNYMFLGSNENDLEIFRFYLNFNINFS